MAPLEVLTTPSLRKNPGDSLPPVRPSPQPLLHGPWPPLRESVVAKMLVVGQRVGDVGGLGRGLIGPVQDLGFECHRWHGGAEFERPVMRLDEVLQLEFLRFTERPRRQRAEPAIEHHRAEHEMPQQVAGRGVSKARGRHAVTLHLSDVVEERADGDEFNAGAHGARDALRDAGDLDAVEQQPAHLRVVAGGGARCALEILPKDVIREEEIEGDAQLGGGERGALLIHPAPIPRSCGRCAAGTIRCARCRAAGRVAAR